MVDQKEKVLGKVQQHCLQQVNLDLPGQEQKEIHSDFAQKAEKVVCFHFAPNSQNVVG